MLNSTDLISYSASQVASLADIDFYAVRDEGFRRQIAAEKKLAKALKAVEAAKKEMAEAAFIIEAAFREQSIAA